MAVGRQSHGLRHALVLGMPSGTNWPTTAGRNPISFHSPFAWIRCILHSGGSSMRAMLLSCGLVCALAAVARGADGNRLTYLDEADPYYVSRTFPKLVTSQWIGEEGIQAGIVLA